MSANSKSSAKKKKEKVYVLYLRHIQKKESEQKQSDVSNWGL
jgi:hypothetical protein